ncbi:hypothetical protein [Pseudomarimonas salicorniae]|uniref:Peptidase M43 pregnancy-associated plasma-A domain-containing protein n=1 Tax=Pseudomarimonas salicorniae TaxID=2933270 RepID=A0ABT0GDH7_9GAMM|nr:hypothetical protein [Lysobacter sp. CAU 1642]MCK7592599.1 hypothetical protein [Lysobacter sp. CAU 1642]
MSRKFRFQRLAIACMLGGVASAASADVVYGDQAREAFAARQALLAGILDASPKGKVSADTLFQNSFEVAASSQQNCDSDRDGDGLPDCVETNTGRFVSVSDTGTDPDHADTDGDGLRDGEEVLGAETGLDLPALGVSPLRRDLLIEYDWFDSSYDCGPHSQRPTAAIAARVAAMFASAPVLNPDGSSGINVIQDYGQGGLFVGGNRIEGHDAILPGSLDATFHQIKNENFDPARLGYFRYVMMPHRYNGGSSSSGYAEIVGDDAIVSLYCQNSESNVARTIAHEVGHLLGLHHGGFEECNNKPNYNSLMNYRYQFQGVDTQCDAQGDFAADDFSRGDRLSLDENALREPQGVCGNPAIDWNRDGTLQEGLAMDLNPNDAATCGTAMRKLDDFDDWANLTFAGVLDFKGQLKSVQSETGCAGAPVH